MLVLGLNGRSHIMHPKCNPFSFHPYLGKYSDGVIHPGIAGGELNLNKDRLREKAYLNVNSPNLENVHVISSANILEISVLSGASLLAQW